MANITIIAAVGKRGELGKNNTLLWHIKEDMKFFRETTMNKKIIMGRNTFESLGGLLPYRTHIVLTRSKIDLGDQVIVLPSIENLLEYLKSLKEEAMVIGGAQIYKEMLPYTNKMLLTEINEEKEADVYFPEFDPSLWTQEEIGTFKTDTLTYKRVKYTR